MNNLKISIILAVLLGVMYAGLEIVPSFYKSDFSHIEYDKKALHVEPKVFQKECLVCHSYKYDDRFEYNKEFYDGVIKKYSSNPPKDISLIHKIYTPQEFLGIYDEAHLSSEHLDEIVAFLFDEKKDDKNKIGYFVIFYLMIVCVFLYLKIILQQKN